MKFFLILSLTSLILSISLPCSASMTSHGKKLDKKFLLKRAKHMFSPIKKYQLKKNTPKFMKKRIELGKILFFEKRLSSNNKMSCNTCHNLKTYGVDNQATSLGVKGKRGGRNSPTVYNAFMHISQFWDGREEDVESQAVGPITNPDEMNMSSPKSVVKKIKAIAKYPPLFKAAFIKNNNPLTFKNIGIAIGAFERTLSTPSKFDDYLNGKKNSLNNAELTGLNTFIQTGCATCHNGAAIGGSLYRKMGLALAYKTKDLGRFEVTKNKRDMSVFKVPSLRNIEKTGPYFHDGSIKTLEEAITLMAKHQLGSTLSSKEVREISTFLKSLTAKIN